MQQLNNLPEMHSSQMAAMAHSMPIHTYPSAQESLLQSSGSIQLYNGPGCGPLPCTAMHATGAIHVLDVNSQRVPLLLPVAESSWIGRFTDKSSGASLMDDLLHLLQRAAQNHTVTDPSTWVRVVAVPLLSRKLHGVVNHPECAEHASSEACQCTVDLPRLFSPGLYGSNMIPVMLLNVQLRADTPDIVVKGVEASFANFFPLYTHQKISVCTSSPRHIPQAPSPCSEVDVPVQPSPLPCANSWTVQLHRGLCPSMSEQAHPRPAVLQTSQHTTFDIDSIDLFKSTCDHSFPGFPAAWASNYCAYFDAHLCLQKEAQVVRFSLQATGSALVPASLAINNNVAAWVEKPAQAQTWNMSEFESPVAEKLLVLSAGCHHITVTFEDMEPVNRVQVGCMRKLVRSQLMFWLMTQLRPTLMPESIAYE
jgi:hypothetical protein